MKEAPKPRFTEATIAERSKAELEERLARLERGTTRGQRYRNESTRIRRELRRRYG